MPTALLIVAVEQLLVVLGTFSRWRELAVVLTLPVGHVFLKLIGELRDDLTCLILCWTEKNFGREFLVFEVILLLID